MNLRKYVLLAVLAGAGLLHAQPPAPKLELKPGDHIALIGSVAPDRFQHSGWLETLIHARYPQHNLVVRDLAAPGDEVVTRHRSENFGTPDDWLKRVQADVIFAFFGSAESVKGREGVAKYKADLEKWIKDTQAKDYSGKGAPRIVLFSPVAQERHQDPNYPDPSAANERLREYTAATAEVAKANGVEFVDLFNTAQELYRAAAGKGQSLTVNGLYLTDEGDKEIAPVIFKSVFGEAAPAGDLEKLRAAVNEKNALWHSRYRTIDGYNVYGGRSALAYQPEKGGFISDRTPPAPYVSNYKIMQEEMSQRDVMTANRDKRVWAVAKGGDLQVDDSNLPEVEKVKTNHPGPNADETWTFLGGQEAIGKMTVHSSMKVNLFASEEQFPELVAPVQMAWDTKGRLWVSAWLNYPERKPTSKTGDSLLMLEDTDGDGKADKCTHYLDDLNAPTGFQFYKDGVLVMQAPDLWFARDTSGKLEKANSIERVLMGMDSADSHHTANAICLDPGGSIYLSDGVFHRTQVETAYGITRNDDAAIYRFEPRTGKFETYVAYGFANPHGRVFDYWGNDIITDATGNNSYFGPAFSGHLDYPMKHAGLKDFWNRPSRPCPGTGILSSRHFPDEFQGDFLNCNVIGFQGIYLVKVTEDGSGLKGETQENLVSSSDPNFRPSAVNVGPDGAIYFADWHNPIIGHMQHHLRDPNRDHGHGRIYRITYEGRPLVPKIRIAGEPVPALLDLLKSPENRTRELAKVELGGRDTAQVIAAVKRWADGLDKNDPAYEHHMMEALWVHQWHNVVDVDLLKRMLRSPEPRARAAAGRVLCYWRDRVPDSLSLFATMADDENPRVRLEAVRGASFYREAAAADVALAILKHPTDYYLDYTLKETLRQLEQWWRKAIAEGKPVSAGNPAGINHLIGSLTTAELMKMPRTGPVLEALLIRNGVADADRNVALDDLAKARNSTRVAEALRLLEAGNSAGAVNVARLLPWQAPDQLKASRGRLAALAGGNGPVEVRQAAWASLALADGSFDTVWNDTSKIPAQLTEVLNGIPLLQDPDFRAKAYGRVLPLLSETPAGWAAGGATSVKGRYVRISLPQPGTLTLAEVQVFSDGKNIAPQGAAKQSSTSSGGTAAKAIDGRTDGVFNSGTQTHTRENDRSPWWEVDLGGEQPIESVVIWNRTEDGLGKRLEGYTLEVLDGNRREAFKKAGNPAPAESARIAVSSDPVGSARRAAIRAVVSMNHEPATVFGALSSLIGKSDQVTEAARGIRALPAASWPKAKAGETATALVAWAKTVPAGDRTSQDFVETVQLAGDLAGFLPADKAAALRTDLKGLRVAVFVLRTVREQMRYDAPRLVVEAGKPFELIVANDDFMPHNVVVVKPGAREAVGQAAATMLPDQLDSKGRAFIPNRPEILGATRLIESGQRETLKLTAPSEEGDCEYVCTFPGHYQVMWGRLVVTKDVDAYLQAHPEAPAVGATGAAHKHGFE